MVQIGYPTIRQTGWNDISDQKEEIDRALFRPMWPLFMSLTILRHTSSIITSLWGFPPLPTSCFETLLLLSFSFLFLFALDIKWNLSIAVTKLLDLCYLLHSSSSSLSLSLFIFFYTNPLWSDPPFFFLKVRSLLLTRIGITERKW